MNESLKGRRYLAFVGADYEDLELWYPKLRLEEAGGEVVLAGQAAGVRYKGKNGYPCISDIAITDVDESTFDGVICAGGWMPDKLRRDARVLQIVRALHESNRLVAAICHGGWIPISAGVYSGVHVTGSPGIKDDLVNAGAIWVDGAVVIDGHHVTSRRPDDLPQFMQGVLQVEESR